MKRERDKIIKELLDREHYVVEIMNLDVFLYGTTLDMYAEVKSKQ